MPASAQKSTRMTNRDLALSLHRRMTDIRLQTTSPAIRSLAHEAASLALSADNCLENAAFLDQSRGGGSGEAWSYRSKAGRHLAKARKLEAEIGRLGASLVDSRKWQSGGLSEPTVDAVLFLRQVAAGNGRIIPQLMADQDRAVPCHANGWLDTVHVAGADHWKLSQAGDEILFRYGRLADGA